MPIYDILMSIGLWKDDIHSLLYIPKPCMPDAGRLVDCTVDYLDDVGSCIAYDWEGSWSLASDFLDRMLADEAGLVEADWEARDTRVEDLESRLKAIKKYMRSFETLQKKEVTAGREKPIIIKGRLFRKTSRFSKMMSAFVGFGGKRPMGDVDLKELEVGSSEEEPPDWDFDPKSGPDTSELDALGIVPTWDELVAELGNLKRKISMWTPQPQTEYLPVTGIEPDDLPASPYGAWLGVSPQLWRSWQKFVSTASVCYTFSLSFPHDVEGCATWILPIQHANGKDFATLPRRDIAPVEWKLAVMCPLARWDCTPTPGWTSNWITRTTELGARDVIITAWLLSFVKSEIGISEAYAR
jgi:hypothetical protein